MIIPDHPDVASALATGYPRWQNPDYEGNCRCEVCGELSDSDVMWNDRWHPECVRNLVTVQDALKYLRDHDHEEMFFVNTWCEVEATVNSQKLTELCRSDWNKEHQEHIAKVAALMLIDSDYKDVGESPASILIDFVADDLSDYADWLSEGSL